MDVIQTLRSSQRFGCTRRVQTNDTSIYRLKRKGLGDAMALKKGTTVDRGYATVANDEGVNYREIADTMTELGFPMNHSSARNYVLRVMRKFAENIAGEYDIELNEDRINEIAKSPDFQHGIADLLHDVEVERRASR